MIQVEQGMVLSLQFTAFDMDFCPDCGCDHLTIMDGDGTTLMEKSCGSSSSRDVSIGTWEIGSSLPPLITSTSNVVRLHFTTDGGAGKSGWSVSWNAVTPGDWQ